jgi:hypothetical protein
MTGKMTIDLPERADLTSDIFCVLGSATSAILPNGASAVCVTCSTIRRDGTRQVTVAFSRWVNSKSIYCGPSRACLSRVL